MQKLVRASSIMVLIVASLLAAPVITGHAQTADSDVPKPNISGTWKLNIPKSNFGASVAPLSQTEVISQSGDSITFTITTMTETGTSKYAYCFKIGDPAKGISPYQFKPEDKFKVQDVKAAWTSGSLVVTINATMKDESMTITSHYTLARDGQRMSKATYIDKDSGPVYTAEFYEKI